MTVKVLKLQCASIELNGMIHVDWNIIRLSYVAPQEDRPVESDSDSEDADPELEPPTKFTRLSLRGHI